MSTHPALVEGRVAVVTGAASGIGLAAAKRFAAMGLKVCMADRRMKLPDIYETSRSAFLTGCSQRVQKACELPRSGCGPVLTAAHGSIPSADLYNSDGWHLSEEGSNLLTAAIRQSLQPP